MNIIRVLPGGRVQVRVDDGAVITVQLVLEDGVLKVA